MVVSHNMVFDHQMMMPRTQQIESTADERSKLPTERNEESTPHAAMLNVKQSNHQPPIKVLATTKKASFVGGGEI